MIYPFGYYGSRRRFYTRPNFSFFRPPVGERGTFNSPHRPQPPLSPPQERYLSQPNFQDPTEFIDEAGFRPLYGEDYGGGYEQLNREFSPQNGEINSHCKQYKTLCNYSNRQTYGSDHDCNKNCECDKKCSCNKQHRDNECNCDKNCRCGKPDCSHDHDSDKSTHDYDKNCRCGKPHHDNECNCDKNCECSKPDCSHGHDSDKSTHNYDKNCRCGKPDCSHDYDSDKSTHNYDKNCRCGKPDYNKNRPCEQSSANELNSTIGNMCKCCKPSCDNGANNTNAAQNICENGGDTSAQGQCYGGYYGGYGDYNGYNNFSGYGGGCNGGVGCGNFGECGGCNGGCLPPMQPCIPLPPRPPIEQFCPCTPPLYCPNYPLCPQPRPIAERVEEVVEEIAEENCDRCRFVDRRCGFFGNLFRR